MAISRNPIVDNPGVVQIDRTTGEYLQFTLTAGGPIPIFSFSSSVKGTLFEAPDFPGHPKKKYQWLHLKNPSDMQAFEMLDVHMAFITNQKYRYKVEKMAKDDSVKATILDINYSGDPTDHVPESFVLLVK